MSSPLADRDYKADVKKAYELKTGYVQRLLKAYVERQKYRDQHQIPVLAFCGYGRAGKDLGAEWLGHNYDILYGGSTSEIMNPLIAAVLEKDEKTCYAERHEDRLYWFNFCNTFRADDPTLLAKMLLSRSDTVVGIRGAIELESCISRGILNLAIWVENPRVDVDPTVEYISKDCDIIVENGGTKMEYFAKLRKLANCINLPIRVSE
jgi:hypothetical protein